MCVCVGGREGGRAIERTKEKVVESENAETQQFPSSVQLQPPPSVQHYDVNDILPDRHTGIYKAPELCFVLGQLMPL